MTEETKTEEVKVAPPPEWYKQVDWLNATVDLSEGGWGTVKLEEPTGPKADSYWDTVRGVSGKDEEEIDSGSISKITISQLSIYVAGGDDKRVPTKRYDKAGWTTCYALMPKRVAKRIVAGIELFAASGESEGNS